MMSRMNPAVASTFLLMGVLDTIDTLMSFSKLLAENILEFLTSKSMLKHPCEVLGLSFRHRSRTIMQKTWVALLVGVAVAIVGFYLAILSGLLFGPWAYSSGSPCANTCETLRYVHAYEFWVGISVTSAGLGSVTIFSFLSFKRWLKGRSSLVPQDPS